jgi:hypothetical protein
MAKKTKDYDDEVVMNHDAPEVASAPRPRYLTLMDGTTPVYLRASAVEGFTRLGGDPPAAFRVLLRSGQAVIVSPTEAAKEALLDALVE